VWARVRGRRCCQTAVALLLLFMHCCKAVGFERAGCCADRPLIGRHPANSGVGWWAAGRPVGAVMPACTCFIVHYTTGCSCPTSKHMAAPQEWWLVGVRMVRRELQTRSAGVHSLGASLSHSELGCVFHWGLVAAGVTLCREAPAGGGGGPGW
jgi:hypothetical protein